MSEIESSKEGQEIDSVSLLLGFQSQRLIKIGFLGDSFKTLRTLKFMVETVLRFYANHTEMTLLRKIIITESNETFLK